MITMLSSINTTLWPVLMIFGYLIILIIPMLFSLLTQVFNKLLTGSITKKIIKNRIIRSFLPLSQRHTENIRLRKIDEKKEVLKAIDLILIQCHLKRNTFIIHTDNQIGHTNRAYI
jgi:hypothetical protein